MFSWLTGSAAPEQDAAASSEASTAAAAAPAAADASAPTAPPEIKDLSAYKTQIDQTIAILKEEADKEAEWDLISDQDGIKVYLKNSEENPIKSAKAKGLIKKSPMDIVNLIQNLETYKEVDRMFQEGKVVQHYDHHNEVLYSLYSSGYMLIANRDFCYFENRNFEADGTVTISCFSIEHPHTPEVEGVVRGHIHYSGWLFRTVTPPAEWLAKHPNETWTETVFLAQVDPKGWLPVMLINQASQEVGTSISNIRAFFKRKRQTEKAASAAAAAGQGGAGATEGAAADGSSSSSSGGGWFW